MRIPRDFPASYNSMGFLMTEELKRGLAGNAWCIAGGFGRELDASCGSDASEAK